MFPDRKVVRLRSSCGWMLRWPSGGKVAVHIRRKFRSAKWHVERYRRYLWSRYRSVEGNGRPHGLDRPLIVSLTSFPARFNVLHLTLKCLLSQTVKPDAVVLWIVHADGASLPHPVLALEHKGLTIRFCRDTKSFKKIIPALSAYPDSFIVTADDDMFYPDNWLEALVTEYAGNRSEVLCHRAHKIRLNDDGRPLPYRDWEFETSCRSRSPLMFPTSGAGVLYPPGVFDLRVSDEAMFSSLCPTADDIWLYWMARLNGAVVRCIGSGRVAEWPNVEGPRLSRDNLELRNDLAIAQMIGHFGLPLGSLEVGVPDIFISDD